MADETNNNNNSISDDNYHDAQMQHQHQHQLTQAQLEAIESDIKATQPLTSPLLPISVLVQQYTNNNVNTNTDTDADDDDDETTATGGGSGSQAGFLQAATFLSKKYTSYRTIRGDGNCYYRSFLYSLCERLLRSLLLLDDNNNTNDNNDNTNDIASKKEFNRIKQHISKSLKWVCQYGYDEYTIDMFHEELVELFDFIQAQVVQVSKKKKNASVTDVVVLEDALKELHTKLNEENAVSASIYIYELNVFCISLLLYLLKLIISACINLHIHTHTHTHTQNHPMFSAPTTAHGSCE